MSCCWNPSDGTFRKCVHNYYQIPYCIRSVLQLWGRESARLLTCDIHGMDELVLMTAIHAVGHQDLTTLRYYQTYALQSRISVFFLLAFHGTRQ
jgi:hypothetical protein